MNLDELISEQKQLTLINSTLSKERRVLAEKYKFEFDKYNNSNNDGSEYIKSLEVKLDKMKSRAQEITRIIDANIEKKRVIQIKIESFK